MEVLRTAPLTAAWGFGFIVSACLISANVTSMVSHVFLRSAVFSGREFWRILTSACCGGPVDIPLLLLISRLKYFRRLEERHYANRRSALTLHFFVALAIVVALSSISSTFRHISEGLVSSFTYLCSKIFPGEQEHIWFVRVPIQYVPFLVSGLALVLSDFQAWDGVIGIATGHILFCLLYVFPAMRGRPILTTPLVLRQCLDPPAGEPRAI